jgi:hypothetical protein
VCTVLQRLREHNLVVKRSKCAFGAATVAYLGHIISAQGVAMDTNKVAAVRTWPLLHTVHAVCGFLGLTIYHHKFICLYGEIAALLTRLLTHDAFSWTPEVTTTFEALKIALMTVLVLHVPNFSKPFDVDCDASGTGFGVVLHHGVGPITFFSCTIAPHHAKLAAYERELISLVKAVRHWRSYLWAQAFIIRT